MSLYSMWARKRYEDEQRRNAEEQEKLNMMKLSEWLEAKKDAQPIIFVDQDETLLKLAYMKDMAHYSQWANDNAHFAEIMGNKLAIIPRPHAKAFLSECRRMATVCVLTAGTTFFQEQVLHEAKLFDMIEAVYGRDAFFRVPKGENGILVDNLPHTHPNSEAKLQAMGGGMFIKVPDWNGDDPNDNALMTILPKIRKVFQRLSAA